MSVETMKQRRFDAGTTVLTDRDLFALTQDPGTNTLFAWITCKCY